MSSSNTFNACRLCGKFVETPIPIFQTCKQLNGKAPIRIIEIYFTSNFLIWKNDGLPQEICIICFRKFILLDNFFKECEKSQILLKRYFALNDRKQQDIKTNIKQVVADVSESTSCTFKVEPYITNYQNEDVDSNCDENYEYAIIQTEETKMKYENNTMIKDEIIDYNSFNGESEDSDSYFNDDFKEDFRFTCHICQENFEKANQLDSHIKTHKVTPYTNVICEHCGTEFNLHSYKIHILVVKKGSLPFSCEQCDEKFQSTQSLRHHIRSIHKQHAGKVSTGNCPHCNEVFSDKSNLIKHITDVHKKTPELTTSINTNTPLFQCSTCKRQFVSYVSLKKHETKIHTLKREQDSRYRPQECAFCGQIFGRSYHLKYHIESLHAKELNLNYQCVQCEKYFAHNFQLTQHIRKTHEKTKEARKCDKCDKIYYTVSTYRRHIAQHSDRPQFKCIICSKEFRKARSLKKHEELHNFQAVKNLTYSQDIVNEEIKEEESTDELKSYEEIEISVGTTK